MTRWIGLCAVATVLLSSFGASAATNPARDSQAQQAKAQQAKALAAKAQQAKPLAAKALAKPAPAKAKTSTSKPKVKLERHRVWKGQTLGLIAKRYNVTIEALCNANGLSRRDPIQPAQMLYVPQRSDKDGSQARQLVLGESAPPVAVEEAPAVGKPSTSEKLAATKPSRPEAAKNNDAAGNAFPKVAPARAALPAPGTVAKGKKGPSWTAYTKAAAKKGYVVLNATGRNWKGYAIVKGNRLSSNAQTGFNHALYSWRTGKQGTISPALIRILTKVSDTFGGRALRVASGYREHSHFKESRHKLGHACDFSVVGVPNNVLRDYLLTLDGVGVGYYPNSSFVHLDVRRVKTYWIDFAGPGERPRKTRLPAAKPGVNPAPNTVPSEPTLPDLDGPVASSPWPRVQPAHSPLLASTFSDDAELGAKPAAPTPAASASPRPIPANPSTRGVASSAEAVVEPVRAASPTRPGVGPSAGSPAAPSSEQ